MESNHLNLSEGSTPLWWAEGIIDEWMRFLNQVWEGRGWGWWCGRAALCCFPLYLKYCLLRETGLPSGHLCDPMGLRVPAWLLHGPSSPAEQAEATAALRGAAWLSCTDTGWVLRQLGPGIARGKDRGWWRLGEEWESSSSSTQGVRVLGSTRPLLPPCWRWRAAGWDSWGRRWQGPPHVSKDTGMIYPGPGV